MVAVEIGVKKLAIGCGGLIGVVILIVVIIAVVGGGSDSGSQGAGQSGSVPPTPPPLYNVYQIWDDFEANETRANKMYKGIWLTVQLDQITKIESGGKVQMDMDSIGWSHVELDFRNDDDVLHLDPGQSITAICKLSGFELDAWLNFKDCRFAQ